MLLSPYTCPADRPAPSPVRRPPLTSHHQPPGTSARGCHPPGPAIPMFGNLIAKNRRAAARVRRRLLQGHPHVLRGPPGGTALAHVAGHQGPGPVPGHRVHPRRHRRPASSCPGSASASRCSRSSPTRSRPRSRSSTTSGTTGDRASKLRRSPRRATRTTRSLQTTTSRSSSGRRSSRRRSGTAEIEMRRWSVNADRRGHRRQARVRTTPAPDKTLTGLGVMEAFMVYIKVSLLCGVVIACPWIFCADVGVHRGRAVPAREEADPRLPAVQRLPVHRPAA